MASQMVWSWRLVGKVPLKADELHMKEKPQGERQAEAAEVTKFSNAEVQAGVFPSGRWSLSGGQAGGASDDLGRGMVDIPSSSAEVDLVKPLAQQAEAATKELLESLVHGVAKELERFTVARLAWEAEAEMRARTDEPKVGHMTR